MRAGIAIDDWKLPFFEAALRKANVAFKTSPGVTPDTLLISVEVGDAEAMTKLVKETNFVAKRSKMQ